MEEEGVSPDYVKGLEAAGYRDLSPSQILKLARHGVQLDMIQRLQELGLGDLSIDEIVQFSIHDVNPEFVSQMRQLGFDDLSTRGLLESTLILTMAEFGRTPNINASLGRDHFASAWSVSLTGCGVKGGSVYGESDADGQTVKDGKVGAGEVFATIFQALGIDHTKEYHTNTGRPITIVRDGHVIDKLFG